MNKKIVKIKDIYIGGEHPIAIQSMTNIPFNKFDELLEQSLKLQQAGCEILRCAVPDMDSVRKFSRLHEKLDIPIVADIHFDYKMAIESIYAGADKIRINPGNIGKEHIKTVANEANSKKIPIRVGINGGSLEKEILQKYGHVTAEGLCESAENNVKLLENNDFDNIVVSIKSSDVPMMIKAYKLYAEKSDYPLHLGVTEAGTLKSGLIKSSIGIGALLLDGIGETIRVSLADDVTEEISAAKTLLSALNLRKFGLQVISCPTCGRTSINSIELAKKAEEKFTYIKKPIKLAIMGCVVNGIGEAGEAHLGVTGVNGEYIVFKYGKIIKKNISENDIFNVIKTELDILETEIE